MKKTTLLFCLLASSALAQQSSLPLNPDSVLKELDKIKETRDASTRSQLNRFYQTITSAISSNSAAMELYLQATYTTQFDGQSHEKAYFQDWKKKEAEKFKSRGFQDGLHLYLVYLGMTLQSSSGIKNADMLPALMNYISQVEALGTDNQKEADQFLKRSVGDSVIVQQAGIHLTPQENWVMNPGSTEEMYQKVILPALRDKKDPAAINYWNHKIDQEMAGASYLKNSYDIDHFATLRKPTLLWSRAQEFYKIGQKDQGIREMLGVIRAYPSHPDADQWAGQLRGYLSGNAPQASN